MALTLLPGPTSIARAVGSTARLAARAQAHVAATLLSAGMVLFQGFLYLCLDGMNIEWELSRFRRRAGSLEVLHGEGLLVGLAVPEVILVAAGGSTLLVVFGVSIRIRICDSLLESTPARIVLAINVFITVSAWGHTSSG
jgi:hypothetical protein